MTESLLRTKRLMNDSIRCIVLDMSYYSTTSLPLLAFNHIIHPVLLLATSLHSAAKRHLLNAGLSTDAKLQCVMLG